ncbi:hypothetical protein JHY03_69820 (plasmid) [Streptomyces sp. CA-256286]|nr:hypothetical protein JHY03_69820 [Streptomyces sp. CA-256286]
MIRGLLERTSDHEQQPAPGRGKVLEALARAERKVFTRPAPKSAKVQMKFLLTQAKGSTKALAERLGVSRRTVERYRAGKLTPPQKHLEAALVEKTESAWQPQVRAKAREQASTSGGIMVHVVAYFGFTASGSSDDGRERHITTAVLAAPEHRPPHDGPVHRGAARAARSGPYRPPLGTAPRQGHDRGRPGRRPVPRPAELQARGPRR